MSKRCPPGVICIENITVIFLLCILIVVGLYFYYSRMNHTQSVAAPAPVIIQKEIIVLVKHVIY